MTDNRETLYKLRFATIEDTDELYKLRLSEYRTSPELALLNESFLLPNSHDKILIVETYEGEIVSTMQGEIFRNLNEVLNKTKTDTLAFSVQLPTFYLSLAATRKDLRNLGFNSIMRLVFIEQAKSSIEIQSFSGIVFDHAPRLNLMRELGYELNEIKPCNLTYWQPKEITYWATLKTERFDNAIQILRTQCADLIHRTQIDINEIKFKWSPSYLP